MSRSAPKTVVNQSIRHLPDREQRAITSRWAVNDLRSIYNLIRQGNPQAIVDFMAQSKVVASLSTSLHRHQLHHRILHLHDSIISQLPELLLLDHDNKPLITASTTLFLFAHLYNKMEADDDAYISSYFTDILNALLAAADKQMRPRPPPNDIAFLRACANTFGNSTGNNNLTKQALPLTTSMLHNMAIHLPHIRPENKFFAFMILVIAAICLQTGCRSGELTTNGPRWYDISFGATWATIILSRTKAKEAAVAITFHQLHPLASCICGVRLLRHWRDLCFSILPPESRNGALVFPKTLGLCLTNRRLDQTTFSNFLGAFVVQTLYPHDLEASRTRVLPTGHSGRTGLVNLSDFQRVDSEHVFRACRWGKDIMRFAYHSSGFIPAEALARAVSNDFIRNGHPSVASLPLRTSRPSLLSNDPSGTIIFPQHPNEPAESTFRAINNHRRFFK